MTTDRITLSDTGLSKQEGVFELETQIFSLVEKQEEANGDKVYKVIRQTPKEALAYARFVYQHLQIPRVSFGEKKQRPPLIITDADWHKENPDQKEAVY